MKTTFKRALLPTVCVLAFAILLTLFPACGEKTAEEPSVTMLTIVSKPDKLVYEEGEMFDDTGLVINALMSDGSTLEDVEYNCKKKDALTRNDKSVSFTYGGKSVYQAITVNCRGNNDMYSVENTPALTSSALEGKTYLFLGSSVTYGYGSLGQSMADFLAKRNGCAVIKEAVSGTTLADIDDSKKGLSYVKRLENYIAEKGEGVALDAFVCQLSTNDMYNPDTFGEVTAADVTDLSAFNKATTFGAMEYITALVAQTWGCPVIFYTNSYIRPSGNAGYESMIDALHGIVEKWGVIVLDLYNDKDFNAISDEQYELYMSDNVHPTKAGYRDWWLPKFEQALIAIE